MGLAPGWVLKMPLQLQPIEKIRNEEHHIPKKLRPNKQSVFSVYFVCKTALNLMLTLIRVLGKV